MSEKKLKILNPIKRSEENLFGIQHDPLEYYKPSYLKPNRMSSYGYQYKLAMQTECKSFLNIGSANNLLHYLLSKQDKFIIDLDLDFRTNPDVVAVLPCLPYYDNSFDVVFGFQILEHFPLSMFTHCLQELKRVAKKHIILSLPDISFSKNEQIKYRLYKFIRHPQEWGVYKPLKIDKEHFWEIGYGSTSIDTFLKLFEKEQLRVQNHFRNELYRYHHFFVLDKIKEDASSKSTEVYK